MTLVEYANVFEEFRQPSWSGWRNVLARITPTVRDFYAIVGRGAGKSRIVALIACWFATREYRRVPGEHIYIGVFAPDRKQAGVTLRYVVGLLKSVPALAALIVAERTDSIELSNGIIIEVVTASIAAPRGRAYALVIVEEAAFLRDENSASPDVELLRAVRPALARVPGSLLAVVSSPYARRGVLYQAWAKHYGKPGDVIVIQAPTLDLNPTFDQRAIDTAYEEDPASAAAEYGAEFRSDVETFISRQVLDAVTVTGRHELPRQDGRAYVAFVDPSGGSADSFTLAVAHTEQQGADDFRAVLDVLREVKPPFSPESVVEEFTTLLDTYGITVVSGDRYAGEWPREQFRKNGVDYIPADKSKSDIYRDLLPHLNSGRVELLDSPRLISQLASLERRTARGGKDSIDHPPKSHDDLANAAAGALLLAATDTPQLYWDEASQMWLQDLGITI